MVSRSYAGRHTLESVTLEFFSLCRRFSALNRIQALPFPVRNFVAALPLIKFTAAIVLWRMNTSVIEIIVEIFISTLQSLLLEEGIS